MTSRSSFSNYFRQGPKRFLWAFSLSGLLFFLCIFVPTMMVLQVDSQNPEKTNVVRASEINMVIGTDNFATPVVLLLLAVIMGVVTFNYLHNKSKVDLFHSLPISRGKLFFTEYFWAIVSILTGFFLFWGLSCGLVCLYGYESLILWREVLPMVLSLVVYFLTTFGLTVIGVVLCGHTVISLMMVVVLLGGPVAFALVTAWAQDQFLNTYIGMSDNVLYLSPVTSYFAQYLGDMSAPFVTVFYGVFSILLFVTGYLLYRFRPSESCGSSLSFPIIKGMLEVFVGCISAIGFGLLFYNLISTLPWMFFGILLGGTLIHIFAQVSFEFTFPAIFKKKHYLLSVVLMSSLFMVALVYDLRGFDRMTLDESDIQSYRIHCGSDVIGDVFGNTVQDAEYLTENTDLMAELIALGAQPYAEDWSTEELYKSGSYWVTVQVKTGPFSSFERCYVIENTEQSTALLQEIVWSDENVTNNLIFNRYPDAVLEYSSLYLWTDEYYSLTDTQCVQITQALHADYEGYDPTAAGDVLASFSANLQTCKLATATAISTSC